MRPLLQALRFMRVVPPMSPLLQTTGMVLVVAIGIALAVGALRGRDAVVPLLVFQLFAVSTGFATYARRGHYDVLLTAGIGRVRTALAQWIAAAAPGAAAWLVLAACEAAVSRGVPESLTAGPSAGMLVVSTVPWALTVGLPRFSGAIGWVLACAMAAVVMPEPLLLADGRASGWWATTISVLFPPAMARQGMSLSAQTTLSAVLLGVACMALACAWVARRDIPLEAGQ